MLYTAIILFKEPPEPKDNWFTASPAAPTV